MTYLRKLGLGLVLQLLGGSVAAAVDTWVLSGTAKDLGYDVIGAVYVTVMLVAARRRRPPLRAGWLLVGIGFGLWTVGDLVGSYYSVVLNVGIPWPGPPDVLYLLGYPVAAAGLILLSRIGSRAHSFGDAAIVTCGVGVVFYQLIVDPAIGAPGTPFIQQFVLAAYPLMDLVLLMLVLAAVFAGRLRTTAAVLLGAGILVTLAADLMDTTWEWNSLNAAWLMGYVCVGTAAVAASRTTTGPMQPREGLTRRAERVRIFLLGASVCVVPASLIFANVTGTTNHAVFMNCVSIALLGLVFRRLATLLRRLRTVVSEQHELSGRLQWEAEHDQLTGVANSTAFHLATDAALADPSRQPVSVAFVDLDGFKAINDGAGHRTGDELLRGVADRLRSVLRSSDVIARLGGDEFAILLPKMPADEVVGVGHRIVAAFGRPFDTSHGAIHSHASVGFAEAKPGETSIDVLSNADSAMYEAKRQGKNRYALFDTAARQKAHDRLTMQATLEEALQHDRIEVHYQPIVDAQAGGWHALEALVRCRDDRGELFAPGAFLAVAEDSGLMPTIDRIVLETALQDIARWRQIPGHEELKVGVNVSGRWLLAPDFESTVSATLSKQGLPANALMIELTEDVHIADPVRCGAVLHRLRRAGVKIALDDFGTGYSSLAYLGQLPLDVIKMPLELTSSVTHDERSQALVGAVLSMATALGLQTVGEGIETVEQHETIRDMGCDLVQGYLFAKPQPADIISLELSAGPASVLPARAAETR